MDLLLSGHVAQDVALVATAEHGQLAGIDLLRAELTGVIDADDPFDHRPRRRIPRQTTLGHAVLRLCAAHIRLIPLCCG